MRTRTLVGVAGLVAAGLLLIAHSVLLGAPERDAAQDAPDPAAAPVSGVISVVPNDTAWD